MCLGPNTKPARLLQVAKAKTVAGQLFLSSNNIARHLIFNYDLVIAFWTQILKMILFHTILIIQGRLGGKFISYRRLLTALNNYNFNLKQRGADKKIMISCLSDKE
jgi:hypothetical protein